MLQPLMAQRLSGHIIYQHPLKPPIAKGAAVARLRIRGTSGAELEVPLVAAEPVARGGVVRRGIDTLLIQTARLVGL